MKNCLFFLFLILASTECFSQFTLTGLLPPDSTKTDYIPSPIPLVAGSFENLKEEVNLAENYSIPPAGNQGNRNSCAAWTICYAAKTMYEADENQWEIINSSGQILKDKVFSPSFMFNSLSTGSCNGIELRDALKFARNIGAVPLNDFNDISDCKKRPDLNNLGKEARKYRIESFHKIHYEYYTNKKIDVKQVQSILSEGFPIVLGVQLDSSWDFVKDRYKPKKRADEKVIWSKYLNDCERCYHAMLCVGYIDTDTLQAFKVLNSFGQNWGNNGYIWIPFNVFEESVREAYYMKDAFNIFDENYFIKPKENDTKQDSQLIQENGVSGSPSIKIQSWLKENYFSNYNNQIRLILRGTSKDFNLIEFQIKDIQGETPKTINRLQLRKGESESFIYNGYQYKITFLKFSIKRWQFWKTAAEYSIEISPS